MDRCPRQPPQDGGKDACGELWLKADARDRKLRASDRGRSAINLVRDQAWTAAGSSALSETGRPAATPSEFAGNSGAGGYRRDILPIAALRKIWITTHVE